MVFQGKYYTIDGALSYRKLFDHFQAQARGARTLTMNKDGHRTGSKVGRPGGSTSMILVDLGNSDNNVNKSGEKQPKVEVFEASEGVRRRAVDQVSQELREGSSVNRPTSKTTTNRINKRQTTNRTAQSKSRGHTGNSRRKRKAPALHPSSASTIIKRTRDIFEA
jgi:hypothetical protein